MIEESGFELKDFVVAPVEAMNFGERKIRAKKIGKGAVIEPVEVEPPSAAGIDEAVEDEGL